MRLNYFVNVYLGLGLVIKKKTQEHTTRTAALIYNIILGVLFVGYVEQAGFFYWLLLTAVFFTIIYFGHTWRVFPIIL